MTGWVKVALGTGILAGIAYIFNIKRLSSQVETLAKANLQKFDFSGLTIRVDVTVKNPTKGSLTLKYPFIKLIYKGDTIGSSQVVNKDINLMAYGEAKISAIMIQIPLLGLLSVGVELVKSLKTKGQPINMQIKTISTIELGISSIPYEKTDDVTIKS